MSFMSADYCYPEQATPARWYELYRSTNNPHQDRFEELKAFMHWAEVQGIFMSLSEAATAIESY